MKTPKGVKPGDVLTVKIAITGTHKNGEGLKLPFLDAYISDILAIERREIRKAPCRS